MSSAAQAGAGVLPSGMAVVESPHERIRLLEAVLDNFPGGISLFDKDLRLVLCNQQQKQLLDYPQYLFASGSPTLEQMLRFDAMRGEFGAGDVDELVKLGMAMAAEQRAYVVERTRPNGTILEVRGVPLPGGGFLTTYLDVTQQRQAQALVVHKAHHDPLTNLPNRLLFRDRLQQAIARVGRGEVMAVLCLDLDHFKPVNDSYGHAAGDELLKAVASRLHATARATDTVARVGGDEFVVIQVGIRESAEAAALARRIVKVMAVPCDIAGKAMEIGASIGIAVAPRDGVEPDELLRKADKALYRCKGAGRGNFAFFDQGEGSREGRADNCNAAKSLCADAVAS